jgi:hypothetical protein
MQHEIEHPDHEEVVEPPAPLDHQLDHSAVLCELWPSLVTDDRRALRRCCAIMREADGRAGQLPSWRGRTRAGAVPRRMRSPLWREHAHASLDGEPAQHAAGRTGRLPSPTVASPAPGEQKGGKRGAQADERWAQTGECRAGAGRPVNVQA